MDQPIYRALNDKIYDKRKSGALELERAVRELVLNREFSLIQTIIEQLRDEFAYAIHQSHARNGGLIGLAATAIALGSELPQYLASIVPPVLACFTDQDARVRYYACEAMYNIAKVAKGEILVYFNDIFDALCRLGADSEMSVKNGAELLDRLIKDIVSESAASYVSVLEHTTLPDSSVSATTSVENLSSLSTAFSLPLFIPLLKERIWVLNPFTRQFLVGWITLLDSIPDLELVTYLPEFLGGLLKFLSGPSRDVHVLTQACLDKFLNEIKRISRIKKGIDADGAPNKNDKSRLKDSQAPSSPLSGYGHEGDEIPFDSDCDSMEDDWVPGQDVHINYRAILEILIVSLDSPLEENSLLESLRWIVELLDISPQEVLPFTPNILSHMLPAMASSVEPIRQAAIKVNSCLMNYIVSLADESDGKGPSHPRATKEDNDLGNTSHALPFHESSITYDATMPLTRDVDTVSSIPQADGHKAIDTVTPVFEEPALRSSHVTIDLDYTAAVNSLTLLFLNDHEATRVAALTWLTMLHRKAPRKVLSFDDGTFPALLKTLSDPSDVVVTRDLQLLSQISRHSEDDYFTNFMISLLQLFSTDRQLLEHRGNLIIRQLCVSLSPERIYRTLADCIEKEEDIEFASIMVQNLNNNLMVAPQLAEMRKRLRNLETKDGQTFFVALFRSWCYNSVATFSLCLLAQAYEQAYNLLQIFADLEMTVTMLIQIDKLVQLIESPVFTCQFGLCQNFLY
jgi:vacuole morphology and inheritance protein 14